MKKCFYGFALLFFGAAFSACNQGEGIGGSSSIEGYVYNVVHYDDNYSFRADTFPAIGTKVYISFGDEQAVGDDVDAGAGGYYRFDYLREGAYTVYALSKIDKSGQKIAEPIAVKAKGKLTAAADIYIHTGDAYGTAIIKGTVVPSYHHNGTLWSITSIPVSERRARIYNAGEDFPFDEVRISDNVYAFQKLLPGKYIVSVESEPKEYTTYDVIEFVPSDTITITETGIVYEVPPIPIWVNI